MSTVVSTPSEKRVIPDRLGTPFKRIMASWEVLLFGVAVLIFIFNSLASPYFLDAYNLSDATFNFTEKAMIAFAMALLSSLARSTSPLPPSLRWPRPPWVPPLKRASARPASSPSASVSAFSAACSTASSSRC
jgi:hypothetical protein